MQYHNSLVTSIAALNEWSFPRAVLVYQREIIESGNFKIRCPWTDAYFACNQCYVANNSPVGFGDLIIAYRAATDPALWLFSGSVKDGFPINEVYLASQNKTLWSLDGIQKKRNQHIRAEILQLENDPSVSFNSHHEKTVTVLIGHPNFAHHLWNELSGVDSWLQQEPEGLANCTVKAIYKPLLPFNDLYADKAGTYVECSDPTELRGLQDSMVTRLGATRISSRLRKRIRRILVELRDVRVTDSIEQLLRERFPIVWISVRLGNRTADNQDEFILAAISAVAREYQNGGFILDGFSYPADYQDPIYDDAKAPALNASPGLDDTRTASLRQSFARREEAVTPHVQALLQRLPAQVSPAVVNVSGLGMIEALYLGRMADFYLSHAGTLQHKIAWIYNIQGMVHSNSASVGAGTGNWLRNQLEDGVLPSMLSQDLVEDQYPIRGFNQVERNRDYVIADVAAAVDEVLLHLKAALKTELQTSPDAIHDA